MAYDFLGTAGAAFQGFQEQQQHGADEARRAKADQRTDQDQTFQEEARSRQRADWQRQDKILADDQASRAEIAKQYTNPVAPSGGIGAPKDTKLPAQPATASTPEAGSTLPPATGLPKPHNFNQALDQQLAFLNGKLARGSLSAQDYAVATSHLNKIKEEGIHDALSLMAQGRYDDAIGKYNASGAMRGSSVVEGKEGVTKINGQDVPTHFVTVQNADGSRSVMDVAKAQYQLLDMNSRLGHIDKARQTEMQREHNTGTLQLGREQLAQSAKDAAASRALQSQHFGLQWQQFNATTPAGMIAAKEKALGRPLTPDEKGTMLGVDTLAPAIRLQLNSLLKEQDQLAQAINKAQADGTWQEADKDGKANPLLVRQALLKGQVRQLLQANRVNDPLGLSLPKPNGVPPAPAATPHQPNAPIVQPLGLRTLAPVSKESIEDANIGQWMDQHLIGMFDGPNKYKEIAETNPNPTIRRIAQKKYQAYLNSQQGDSSTPPTY